MVLDFYCQHPPTKKLPLYELTWKVVMLLQLTMDRQHINLTQMHLSQMQESEDSVTFIPPKPIKTCTKHHYITQAIAITPFPEKQICLVHTLWHYIATTKLICKRCFLFITMMLPLARPYHNTIS